MFGLLLCCLGCGVDLPTAEIRGIVPARGWSGEVTPVRIEGDNLYPVITMESGSEGIAQNTSFDVWLVGPYPKRDERRLGGVARVNSEALEAYVPEGLVPGTYNVRVRSPSRTDILSNIVFEVTSTRADHLLLESADWVHEVGARTSLQLSLRGPDGAPVAEPLAFRVEALDEEKNWVGEFSSEDPRHVVSKGRLEGVLDALGTASFDLQVEEQALLTLQAFPVDTDSSVLGDVIKMSWIASTDTTVEIEPVTSWDGIIAGAPFQVRLTPRNLLGEVVEDLRDVTLTNACANLQQEVRLKGVTTLDVALFTATGTERCALSKDMFIVAGEAEGQSAGFAVLAGATTSFQVMVAEDVVRAGTDVRALARSVDAWSNPSAWPGSPVLQDTQGGLIGGACDVPIDASAFCEGMTTVAGEEVALLVSRDGVEGTSSPYRVIASAEVGSIEVEMDTELVTAGEGFRLRVYPRDVWGNPIPANDSELAWADWVFATGGELPECTREADESDGALAFECRVYEATMAATINVSTGAAVGESASFGVRSGGLHAIFLSPDTLETSAGDSVVVTGTAVDAWGNTYLRDVSTAVTLERGDGVWTTPSLFVGTAATSKVTGVFERSGMHQIVATYEGLEIGRSETIAVVAAAPSRLEVSLSDPWAWVGEASLVTIEARDAYGNRVDIDSATEGRLRSASGAFAPVDYRLVNGLGLAEVRWDAAVSGDIIEAEGDDIFGESPPILVAADCPGHVPFAATVTIEGLPIGRVCASEGVGPTTVEVSVNAVEPSVAVVRRLISLDGGEAQMSLGSAFDVALEGLGEHQLRYLLVDAAGCGQEGRERVWLGPDDGSIVGDVPVVISSGTLRAGSDDVLDVFVGPALDCRDGLAAGRSVHARVSRGDLVDAIPTGEGLEVVLDEDASATLAWSVVSVQTGGVSSLLVWEDGGVAYGQVEQAITGDDLAPQVWTQDPSGQWEGVCSEVTLVFSEPMRPDTFNFEDLSVSGSDVAFFEWSPDETAVSLVLSEPLSVLTAVHDVVASDITDRAGNTLDGGWAGEEGTDYRGSFGAVGGASALNTCGLAADSFGLFRPDGDPGLGPESDQVFIVSEAELRPAWWVLSVRKGSDLEVVRRQRYPALSSSWEGEWDGRDMSGEVVPNGPYILEVQVVDAVGNVGEACEINVSVDNHRSAS